MLEEQEAFLRAIFDAPDDDTPRLVYADWLEEHGQEIAAQAIRLSVEWFRWPVGLHQRVALHEESERFQAHHPEIVKELARVVRWPIDEPRYGLIPLTVAELSDHLTVRQRSIRCPWWFGSDTLFVRGGGHRVIDATPFDTAFNTLAFQKVVELHMPGELVPVTGTVTDDTGSVTEYPVFEERIVPIITTAGVEALAKHRGSRRLTLLDLTNNNLGNDALRFLARSPHLDRLKRLTIAEGNTFRGRVWQELIGRFGEDVVS
jgi:uncharacterized protein (TIGR02996 family)